MRRELYTGPSDDVYQSVLNQAALVSRGWLDPSPKESNTVFKNMVENITSGRGDAYKSVSVGTYALEELFR